VPFTSVHAAKYKTEDKVKIQTIHKLKTTQKSKQRKTQQNKTSLVQSLLTTLGQETRWTYSTTLPEPMRDVAGRERDSVESDLMNQLLT